MHAGNTQQVFRLSSHIWYIGTWEEIVIYCSEFTQASSQATVTTLALSLTPDIVRAWLHFMQGRDIKMF